MHSITLQTADGELVHESTIPPFLPTRHQPSGFPDVITWGVRVFKLHSSEATSAVYRECFSVALPD